MTTMSQVQRDALNVLIVICDLFPGLVNAHTHVDGSDLTEHLTSALHMKKRLRSFIAGINGVSHQCNEDHSLPIDSTTSDAPSTLPTVPPSPSSESGSTSDATS